MGLFKFLTKARDTNIDDRVGGAYISRWQSGKSLFTDGDYQAQIDNATKWVYKSVQLISAAVASTPLRLYTTKSSNQKLLVKHIPIRLEDKRWITQNRKAQNADREGMQIVEITEHPFFDLMRNVNPFMNEYDMSSLSTQYEQYTGNSYWYVVRNNLGTPERLWVLPSQRMEVIPSTTNFISGYRLRVPDGKEITFGEEEIVHNRYMTPSSTFYGQSPLQAIGATVSIERYMDKFDLDLFYNKAIPETVLISEQDILQKTADAVKKRWKSMVGFMGGNTGDIAVLGSGLKPHQLTMSPQELHFAEGKVAKRDEILGVFGIPLTKIDPSLIKANNDAADKQFLRDTIVPLLKQREQKINEKLMPMWDENVWVQYENPVPEDRVHQLKEDIEYVKAGIKKRNEIRERIGMDLLDPEDGDIVPSFKIDRLPDSTSTEGAGDEKGFDALVENLGRRIREGRNYDESSSE